MSVVQLSDGEIGVSILFVSGSDPDQLAPHHAMAAVWLTARGYEVTALVPGPAGRTFVENPLGRLSTISIPSQHGPLHRLLWQVKLFYHMLCARIFMKPALFYIQGHTVTPAAWLALMFVGCGRVVYHSQDFLDPGRYPYWEFFERHFARRSGEVICNEVNRARFMGSYYRLRSVPRVVRTALPVNWPEVEFSIALRNELLKKSGYDGAESARLISTLGPISSPRGGKKLLAAIAALPRRYILVTRELNVNQQDGAATYEFMRECGLLDRTVFHPRLPYEELLHHAAACDIGILLYQNDSVGNFYQGPGRLTEYLRSGLPVVASNFPGLELLTLKYGLGRVCDPESSGDISAAIRALGDENDETIAANRIRLKELAKTVFAYEVDAWQIEAIAKNAGD